ESSLSGRPSDPSDIRFSIVPTAAVGIELFDNEGRSGTRGCSPQGERSGVVVEASRAPWENGVREGRFGFVLRPRAVVVRWKLRALRWMREGSGSGAWRGDWPSAEGRVVDA